MAYGRLTGLAVSVGGRTEHTAAWATEILESLDYAYDLAAVVELIDQGYRLENLSRISHIVRNADRVGIHVSGYTLRQSVGEPAQLHIERLEIGDSFRISFRGLSEVIDALARCFDPLKRRELKEKVRHESAMNRLVEREAEIDFLIKAYTAMRAFSDEGSNFNKVLPEWLGRDDARELKNTLPNEFARVIEHTLGEVKTLPSGHDSS